MQTKDSRTPAKRLLINFIRKRYPRSEDSETNEITNDMVRFVAVVQRIYTEPQPKVKMAYRKEGKNTVLDTNISTNIEDFGKVMSKANGEKKLALEVAFRRLHDIATKKGRRHGKRK